MIDTVLRLPERKRSLVVGLCTVVVKLSQIIEQTTVLRMRGSVAGGCLCYHRVAQ